MICVVFLEYGLIWRPFNWQATLKKNVMPLFPTLQVYLLNI